MEKLVKKSDTKVEGNNVDRAFLGWCKEFLAVTTVPYWLLTLLNWAVFGYVNKTILEVHIIGQISPVRFTRWI